MALKLEKAKIDIRSTKTERQDLMKAKRATKASQQITHLYFQLKIKKT